MPDDCQVVGVDLSASHVAAAVVCPDGRMEGLLERPFDRSRPATEVLSDVVVPAIIDCVDAANLSMSDIRGIGFCVPGTLRPEEGLCILSPILGWEDVQIVEPLRAATNIPTTIVQKVYASVQGERYFGAGRDVDNFVSILIGTLAEGGIVIGGELYRGDSDSAGEIGHITVDPDGASCLCGNQGCLEAMAAGPAIARMAADSIKLGAQSLLADWANDGEQITAEHVLRAAREGDALAIKIWEKVGSYLGLAISAVITIVNPRRIIMGGKVSVAFDFFAPTLREEVRRRARMVPRNFTDIVPSPLGGRAPLLGSAATALEQLDVKPGAPLAR